MTIKHVISRSNKINHVIGTSGQAQGEHANLGAAGIILHRTAGKFLPLSHVPAGSMAKLFRPFTPENKPETLTPNRNLPEIMRTGLQNSNQQVVYSNAANTSIKPFFFPPAVKINMTWISKKKERGDGGGEGIALRILDFICSHNAKPGLNSQVNKPKYNTKPISIQSLILRARFHKLRFLS